MTRKHFAVAVVLLALAWLCQPFESRAAGEFFGNNDALTVTMPMEFTPAGPQGGPFYPVSQRWTFTNNSGSDVTWKVSDDATWLNFNVGSLTGTATTGTLAASASTSVTVTLDPSAATMTPGTYQANFTIQNTKSNEMFARKVVFTVLPPRSPLSYYKFDETTGTTVIDYSGCGRDGTVVGGGGLDPFAKLGLSSYANLKNAQSAGVQVPALNLYSNRYTACMWVYPTANQVDAAGLLNYRGNGTVAGLIWRSVSGQPANLLGYNWNDLQDNWSWSSNVAVPLNQWSFVALVISPDKGTVYCYDGAGNWKFQDHNITNTAEEFATTGFVGYDSYGGNRVTQGYIDEAMQFGVDLSQTELASYANMTITSMTKATRPSPANGAVGILSPVLHWTPAPGVLDGQVVYVANTLNNLNAATTSTSPYCLGVINGASAQLPDAMKYTKNYFWRVDTYRGGKLLNPPTGGDVWQFQAGQDPTNKALSPDPYAWYRLDDATSVALDSAAGKRHGAVKGYAYFSGNARGNARWVAGRNDGALHLDRGTSTSVVLPSLGLTAKTTNTMSFTAWIKPSATSYAGNTNEGIITYGTGITSAGLVISSKGDLGALWNGNVYSSSNNTGIGMIPLHGEWNFVAMTVSNTTITLYLNDGSGTGTRKWAYKPGTAPASIKFDGPGRIGYAGFGTQQNHYFSGDIDDVRVYTTTLTDFQVYGAMETATKDPALAASGLWPLYAGGVTTFNWSAGAAKVHDVYLNISNLSDAPGKPYYVGTVYGLPSLGYTGLEISKRYTFQFDESNTGGLVRSTTTLTAQTIVNAIDRWINYLN